MVKKRRQSDDVMDVEENEFDEIHDGEDANQKESSQVELQPKLTTSFVSKFRSPKADKKPLDLVTRIKLERSKKKYWTRITLLFPLAPVCAALVTTTFGTVVINVATNDCNAWLMPFSVGAVVLSYILLWFFAYCWMGPKPITTLRSLRLFYFVYGFITIVWFAGFGTSQVVSATASGFQSCLSKSPALFVFAHYQVVVFWFGLIMVIGFIGLERTKASRERQLEGWRERQQKRAQDKRDRERAMEEQVQREIDEEAAREEAENEKKREELFDSDDKQTSQVDESKRLEDEERGGNEGNIDPEEEEKDDNAIDDEASP